MDFLSKIASVLVLLNGLLGSGFNVCVVYLYFNGSQDKNSFNFICLTRAINNIIVLAFNFLLLTFPVVLISENFYPAIIETVIITSTINVYLVNQIQTVAIALNRFIALYLPFRYKALCSNHVTWVIMGALYAQRGYETFTKLYSFINLDCLIRFDSDTFFTPFIDDARNCSKSLPVDSNLIVLMPSIFLSISVVLNLLTFGKILIFYFSNNSNSESTSLARKNIRLFFQTVFQDSLFLTDAVFTFKLSRLSDSRIWAFVSTVFVWESIHSLDGLIMLMFSDRVSTLRAKFARIMDRDNQVSSSSWMGRSRRPAGTPSLPGVA
ncbi:hypothetical protein L3Y34_006299 [Caenorhabditis briggsae]|uniref:G-protein coupled receptors family 1 profile domain-containing protein n=1 Tax=Caenorhabditis briggsae TaxID=6238 RepID=A0AAE9A3N4_CAEBR|nr:hypothetical protein L3Y34_006299 [Caenorhabditis briggsae]